MGVLEPDTCLGRRRHLKTLEQGKVGMVAGMR